MKQKPIKSLPFSEPQERPAILREAGGSGVGLTVTVRDAKSQLSSLLEWVAGGHEITITSDGRPKARLVPAVTEPSRKVFRGMGDFLLSQPVRSGLRADEIIREDRDSRGW